MRAIRWFGVLLLLAGVVLGAWLYRDYRAFATTPLAIDAPQALMVERGMSFAQIEAAAMIATLLQHARFSPAPGHVPMPVARVTLIPRGGMPLRVALTTTAKSFR